MARVDVSLLVSVGGALTAPIALVLSVGQTRRHNLVPVALDIVRESRTDEWFRARDWVVTRLATEHSPDGGVSGLPGPTG
jgi:hypothetical protein